jgi:hypothetical protein
MNHVSLPLTPALSLGERVNFVTVPKNPTKLAQSSVGTFE